jgi:hypothetical protein
MIKINAPFFESLMLFLQENVLNLSKIEIQNFYLKWIEEFDIENGQLLTDVKNKNIISKKQYTPNNTKLLGVDLPTCFGEYSKKRILFVGIDPVRNVKEFNGIDANIDNDIIIGSPYALHKKNFREKRCAAYWEIIKNLQEHNFIYVTDIYKTYFQKDKIRSYDHWNELGNDKIKKSHIEIFLKEIKIVEPNLIVTFGAIAYKNISGQNINVPILPLMHLSPSTRFHNLKNFLQVKYGYNYEFDNRVKAGRIYSEIINTYLKNNH